ncbi:MAG: hypothetical protein R2862_10200 [Thermoanaerobaculia bacterium]
MIFRTRASASSISAWSAASPKSSSGRSRIGTTTVCDGRLGERRPLPVDGRPRRPQGRRRRLPAREVEEICRRWSKTSNFKEYPLAQLILRSVAQGARYGMYFPVETVLMVKALVTFEGVGHILRPGFDVKGVSQKHVNAIFLEQFSPLKIAKDQLRGALELIDALSKAPMLITEGLRLLESTQRQPQENPFAGLKTTLLRRLLRHRRGDPLRLRRKPWYFHLPVFALGLLMASPQR